MTVPLSFFSAMGLSPLLGINKLLVELEKLFDVFGLVAIIQNVVTAFLLHFTVRILDANELDATSNCSG